MKLNNAQIEAISKQIISQYNVSLSNADKQFINKSVKDAKKLYDNITVLGEQLDSIKQSVSKKFKITRYCNISEKDIINEIAKSRTNDIRNKILLATIDASDLKDLIKRVTDDL